MGNILKEKLYSRNITSSFSYEEGKLEEFYKKDSVSNSYRVYSDGYVGIYYQSGDIDDSVGFEKAKDNLARKREYPYGLETGKRLRDRTERELTDKELKDIAQDCMDYLRKTYPQFIYSANFEIQKCIQKRTNDLGMDYTNIDCAVNVYVGFKHADSRNLSDGGFSFSLRDFDKKVFCKMADDYLANYEKDVALPDELIIDCQYYGFTGMVVNQLNAESLALGTSLLSGKVGEKVFSEDFTLYHDVTDKECWFNTFWDGEGCVTDGDKRTIIDKGVIVTGLSDKRCAAKYGVPHTGNAYTDLGDVPGVGGVNARIERSQKTVKELLNGRYAIVILQSEGGFNDKGELSMPVQSSLLTDGEKILGKLPPFTFVTNMFDMFGRDYIGVGSDQPIFNDKQILFRVHKES